MTPIRYEQAGYGSHLDRDGTEWPASDCLPGPARSRRSSSPRFLLRDVRSHATNLRVRTPACP
ncbi:hypothetical protein LB542_24915 [Mesorhizobium sp. BR1-1-9]|uniref:hypothetical protein n=1 Tax=unclassified Mesorhizobium TaxID=325217 RepID=UPI001CD088F1|nr:MULTISPECIES: hypothetical protein [unclassified Mesorhizobium]MBZ9874082.1 hypothetical protein [Mesorhizobium sp. BR1-1-9]MBZ9943869.1 hypothetical protein [Mesorhizobium sp. BR1-1-13]